MSYCFLVYIVFCLTCTLLKTYADIAVNELLSLYLCRLLCSEQKCQIHGVCFLPIKLFLILSNLIEFNNNKWHWLNVNVGWLNIERKFLGWMDLSTFISILRGLTEKKIFVDIWNLYFFMFVTFYVECVLCLIFINCSFDYPYYTAFVKRTMYTFGVFSVCRHSR